jgi:hypothetical protein
MYDEALDDEHDLPTLNTYMWYISSFGGQNVIQLLDASQAAYHLKAKDKFCFVRMLASWKTIVCALLGLAGNAMFSTGTPHQLYTIGRRLV